MRFDINPDVPDQLTVNQCFAGELKAANSHFEFLFLQLSNLNSESPATLTARKELLNAYEKFHGALQSFFVSEAQKYKARLEAVKEV